MATYIPYTPILNIVTDQYRRAQGGGNLVDPRTGGGATLVAPAPVAQAPTAFVQPPAAVDYAALADPVALPLPPTQELGFAADQITATSRAQQALAEANFARSIIEGQFGLNSRDLRRQYARNERDILPSYAARGIGNSGFERRDRIERGQDFAAALAALQFDRTTNLGQVALDQGAATNDLGLTLSLIDQARQAALIEQSLGLLGGY